MSRLTIKDVAREAGVSIATASYVLNDKPGKVSAETRERVQGVAQRLGYRLHPGASQIRGASRSLMVLLPGHALAPDLRSILMDYPFFNELLAGVEHASFDLGLQTTLSRVEQLDDLRQLMNGPVPAGVLVLGKHDDATLEAIEPWEAPIVVVDDGDYFARHPVSRLQDFSIDDVQLGDLAAEHLLALGHRHIALLFGHLHHSSVHRDRLRGVRRALTRYGLTLDPAWLIETDVTLQGAAAAQPHLSALYAQGATAVLAMADILAMGCFHGLQRAGLAVPQQVSLLGIDNLHILNYLPLRLTTVGQDVYGRGYQAVRLLRGHQPELAAVALIAGDSTAACPARAVC